MKKNSIVFIYLIFLLSVPFLGSCSQKSNDKEKLSLIEITAFDEVVILKGKTIKPQIELINPWSLYLKDSLLIIKDKHNSKGLLLILNANDNFKYLAATGSLGQGPGEYLGIKKVDWCGKILWVFDVSSRTITKVNLDSLLQNENYIPKFREKINSQITNFSIVNDTSYVAGYYANKNRFALFNIEGKIFYSFLNYPELENKYGVDSLRFKYGVKSNIYQAKMKHNAKKQLMVLSYYFTGLIQIIDYKNKKFKYHITGPDDNFPPNYVLTSNGMSTLSKEAKDGYLDLNLTDNYIYALYSGKTDQLDIASNQIFQFDWNGNPVRKYVLDSDLISFVVDVKKSKIYGIDLSDSPLKEFDIP